MAPPAHDNEEVQLLSNQEDEHNEEKSQQSCILSTLGYAAAISDVVCISFSLICAQALGGLVPQFELNGWRYVAQFIITAPVLAFKRISILPPKEDIPWVAVTAVGSVIFNIANYTSATYLPVGTAGGVGPSVWLILSALLTAVLDRKCSFTTMLACAICVSGVLLVTQPPFLFGDNEPVVYHPLCGPLSSTDMYRRENTSTAFTAPQNKYQNMELLVRADGNIDVGIGYMWLLVSAVAACVMFFVVNRKLSSLSGFVICFWWSILGIPSQFIIMSIVEEPVLPETPLCMGLLVGHGFGAATGTIFIIFASQLLIPAVASLLYTLEVVILFEAQYTFLRTIYPGRENWMEILGAVFVLIGNAVNPAFEIYGHVKKNHQHMP